MQVELSLKDLNFIVESLRYTKLKFSNYSYPSYEIKCASMDEVQVVLDKMLVARKDIKEVNLEN